MNFHNCNNRKPNMSKRVYMNRTQLAKNKRKIANIKSLYIFIEINENCSYFFSIPVNKRELILLQSNRESTAFPVVLVLSLFNSIP